ncbi:MAG TPA: hypothetical protein VGI86_00875 [Acidimicrobiia bacterium]
MTDLRDHLDSIGEPPSEGRGVTSLRPNDRGPTDAIASPARALFGTLAAGAGVLLLVAAARTLRIDHVHGALFAAAGWCELLFALAMGVRPTRGPLQAGAALNLVVMVVGLVGFGASGLADGAITRFGAVTVVALAAAILIAAVLTLAWPRVGAGWTSGTSVVLSVVPVAVLVVATVGVVPPAGATGTVVKTVAKSSGSATKSLLPPGVEQLFAAALPVVKGSTAYSQNRFTSIASGNDTEQSEKDPYVPLDSATQRTLSHQLALASQVAMRYPTLESALKAGMIPAGGMAPGVGYHLQSITNSINGVNANGSVNPLAPASWIYAGTAPNSPVVGLMYISMTPNAPAGFAGPNDHWHQHTNLCIKYGAGQIQVPFAPDSDVTQQQCANVHGQFMKRSVWMVHAWVVPGWESPASVFSHDNWHVVCPDGTVNVDAIGFCVNQQ